MIARGAAVLLAALAVVAPGALGVVPVRNLAYAALAGLAVALAAAARRPRLAGIALVVPAFCATLAVADLALRADDVDERAGGDGVFAGFPRTPHVVGDVVLWRFAPALKFRGEIAGDLAAMSGDPRDREPRTVVFESDAWGFRNGRAASPRAPDVILLGDSFGVGAGTSQEATWAARLATTYGLRTYNLSQIGASPAEEAVTLATEIDRLNVVPGRTTVVWALFAGNDLDERCDTDLESASLRAAADRPAGAWQAFRARSPLGALLMQAWYVGALRPPTTARALADGRRVLFFSAYVARRGRTVESVRRHPGFACLRRAIDAVARVTRPRRVPVVVAVLPSKEQVYAWLLDGAPPSSTRIGSSALADAVAPVARAAGFAVVDLTPVLIERSRVAFAESGALLWWTDDSHWNAEGHAVAAAAVAGAMGKPAAALRRR